MTNPINPRHYDAKINGHPVQVADVIEAFVPNDAHLSQAIKYLLRAGRKQKSSYLEDVGKGLWWCARAILYKGGTIDLPSQAKKNLVTIDGRPISVARK